MKLIKITKRLCSPNLQKNVKIGNVYELVRYDSTTDGTKVAVVKNGTKEIRINEKRFVFVEQEPKIEPIKKTEEKALHDIRTKLTKSEQEQIALIPLVYNGIAWYYANECREYAARNKVEKLKKLSRTYDILKERYINREKEIVDLSKSKSFDKNVHDFIVVFSRHFMNLEWCVRQEILKRGGSCTDLQIYAHMAALFLRYGEKHRANIVKLVESKIPNAKMPLKDPIMDNLLDFCYAYGSQITDFDFEEKNLQIGMQIIVNNINQIEFGI